MIVSSIWARLAADVVSLFAQSEAKTTGRNFSLSQIEPFVQDLAHRYHIPGISLAVVRQDADNDGVFENYQAHFGSATTDGKAVDQDSLFAIASNSKLFTYMAIGLLIENGTRLSSGEELGWNTKIKDVVPDWDMQDKYARDHVDITDLLAHRSGMPRHDFAHSDRTSPAQVAGSFVYFKPSYELRQQWQYNNQGYITLAHIVHLLSGQTLHDYVDEHIFAPLSMRSTTYNSTHAGETGERTHGFIRSAINETECREWWMADHDARSGREVHPSCLGTVRGMDWWTDTDGLFEAGAGGIVTSSKDALAWLTELLKPTVLPASLVQRASKAIEIAQGDFPSPSSGIVGYGLSQMAWTYRGVNLVGHTGSVPGQRSILVRIPDHTAALMIMTNDDTLGMITLRIIAYKLVEIIAGLSSIDIEGHEMRTFLSQLPQSDGPPAHPAPPTPEQAVIGTYRDRGYGNMTLVSLEPRHQTHSALLNGATARLLPIIATGPVYVAPVDKVFASHLVFTHFSGELFNWTAVALWPELGQDKQPSGEWIADYAGSGSAIIDGNGIGLYGNFWGGEGESALHHAGESWSSDRKRAEADVWFDKFSNKG